MKTVTIDSPNANDLFDKYQDDGKGKVRRVIGKRAGEWMVPDEKLKLKIKNSKYVKY